MLSLDLKRKNVLHRNKKMIVIFEGILMEEVVIKNKDRIIMYIIKEFWWDFKNRPLEALYPSRHQHLELLKWQYHQNHWSFIVVMGDLFVVCPGVRLPLTFWPFAEILIQFQSSKRHWWHYSKIRTWLIPLCFAFLYFFY